MPARSSSSRRPPAALRLTGNPDSPFTRGVMCAKTRRHLRRLRAPSACVPPWLRTRGRPADDLLGRGARPLRRKDRELPPHARLHPAPALGRRQGGPQGSGRAVFRAAGGEPHRGLALRRRGLHGRRGGLRLAREQRHRGPRPRRGRRELGQGRPPQLGAHGRRHSTPRAATGRPHADDLPRGARGRPGPANTSASGRAPTGCSRPRSSGGWPTRGGSPTCSRTRAGPRRSWR